MKKYTVLAAVAVLLAGMMVNANGPVFIADNAFAQGGAAQAKVSDKGAIALGQTKTGRLDANAKHQYMLTLRAAATVSFDMNAQGEPAIDPIIVVQDSGKKIIEQTENLGNTPFAKMIRNLEPGRYYIIASSFGNKVGQYTLSVRRFEPGGP